MKDTPSDYAGDMGDNSLAGGGLPLRISPGAPINTGFFPMINRGLIIIRFKQPFVDWVNEADPYPGSGTRMSIEQVNDDSPAFLIHDYASEEFGNWLEECYELLFEQILEEWYVDPALWPQDRTLKLFKAWCDVEVHSMVVDMVDGPLEDDDYD
jgi:hypothetical protein